MVTRPANVNAYEFVVLASLRAKQLMAGSVRRIESDCKATTMAQMEVSRGLVARSPAGAADDAPAVQPL